MSRTLGVVVTGGMKPELKELTAMRSSAALPFGGRYRAIDFAISNLVNSGINNVGVVMQYSYRSLTDHLGLGREWDLDRKNERLFLLTPYISNGSEEWYKGSADALYKNLTFLERSKEEYVLVVQGNGIYTFDFSVLGDYYNEKQADIVVVCRDISDHSERERSSLGVVNVDENSKIKSLLEKPENPTGTISSLGIYFMKRKLLIELIQESNSRGKYDFVKDVLIPCIENMNVYSYMFSGYWRGINSVETYYKANMELLNMEIYDSVFTNEFPIYTKAKDSVPAKYNAEAKVKNSIIADGCIIEGEVYNSILFRDVVVKRGAVVRDSILMQGTQIGENSTIESMICDKNVKINGGKKFISNCAYPMIITKNSIID